VVWKAVCNRSLRFKRQWVPDLERVNIADVEAEMACCLRGKVSMTAAAKVVIRPAHEREGLRMRGMSQRFRWRATRKA
jgi:hypothetical protein